MATFIPGVTDSPQSFQTPSGSPDFGFLQQQLYRSNTQYEQGLHQVEGDYSSILNAPLTNGENIEQRKQYVGQIQEGLKKLAPQDLSLPKNIAQAENLYAPFWQDKPMLQDIAATRQIQNEYQKAYSARDSKDKDEKATFDPASLGPINQSLQNLKTSKREDIGKIDIPQWTPFINTGQYMSQFKEKEKPEIVWDDNTSKPGYIIHNTNGATTLPGWKTMVAGKLDKRFDPQFNVLGQNEANTKINDYIARNPGATKDQAKEYIANSEYKSMLQNRTENYNSLDAAHTDYQTQLNKLNTASANQKNGLNSKQSALRDVLIKKLQDSTPEWERAKQDYQDIIDSDTLPNITKNLSDYFATNIRNNVVSGYAKSFSEDSKSEIKPDEAFWKSKEINIQLATLQENQRYHNLEQQRFTGWTDRAGRYHPGSLDLEAQKNEIELAKLYATNPELAPGAPTVPGLRIGEKATNLVGAATVPELYANDMTNKRNNIASNMYGVPDNQYRGVSQLLLDTEVGVTPAELGVFNKYQMMHHLGTLSEDEDGSAVIGGADKKLYESVLQKLEKATGTDPSTIKGPEDASGMMMKYATGWIGKTHQNMTDPKAVQFYTGLIKQSSDLYTDINADALKRQQMIKDKIATDPEYRHLAVTRPNGTVDMIQPSDIANHLTTSGLHSITATDESRREHIFNVKDIADSYYKGNFDLQHHGMADNDIINIGDDSYHLKKVNADIYHDPNTPQDLFKPGNKDILHAMLSGIENQYGKPDELRNNINKLGASIIPNAPYYQSQTGDAPKGDIIPITKEGKFDYSPNVQYAQDALLPGNNTQVLDESGGAVGPKTKAELLSLVQHYPEVLGDNIVHIPQTPQYGSDKLQISIAQVSPAQAKVIPRELQGKTFTIDISPDAQSELLQRLPRATGEGYDPIYDNPEHSPAALKAAGVDYTLQYDAMSKKFLWDGTWTHTDPNTGRDIVTIISGATPRTNGGAAEARIKVNQRVTGMLSQNAQSQKEVTK